VVGGSRFVGLTSRGWRDQLLVNCELILSSDQPRSVHGSTSECACAWMQAASLAKATPNPNPNEYTPSRIEHYGEVPLIILAYATGLDLQAWQTPSTVCVSLSLRWLWAGQRQSPHLEDSEGCCHGTQSMPFGYGTEEARYRVMSIIESHTSADTSADTSACNVTSSSTRHSLTHLLTHLLTG
jgi:hypothetical protein